MTYNLDNPYELQNAKEYLDSLIDKGGWIEIKRKAKQRSLAQNRYLYLILGWYGCEFGLSVDEVKIDVFKRTCNREIFERKGLNKRGEEVSYLRSTASLSTAELNTAIERFRNYSSAVANFFIPSPNDTEFLAWCEKEIERNKEFV